MLEALLACCQVPLLGQFFTMLFRCYLGAISVHKMLHVLCVVFLVTTLDTITNSFTLVYGVANATRDGFPFLWLVL